MIKQEIKYTDYNDVERVETHYFHLSNADLLDMQMENGGGLDVVPKRMIEVNDGPSIYKIIKDLIQRSYGVKDINGGFDKDPALLKKFMNTEAYSEFITSLIADPDKLLAFVKGIMPKKIQEQIAANEKAILAGDLEAIK